MDTKQNRVTEIFWTLIAACLLCSCSASPNLAPAVTVTAAAPTDKAKPEPALAFHTSDGGATWTSEIVPVPAGPVYLARAGKFLTVISGVNQLTLLRYDE